MALTAKLEEILAKDPNVRPFVCDGRPEECRVFIVGTNPATAMREPFKDFWSSESGFDKKAWFKSYGDQRDGKWSPTRHVIEGVIEAAPGVGFLETNVYATATASEADILSEHRDSDFFKVLVETVRPKVIIAHGREAYRTVGTFFRCTLKPSREFVTVPVSEDCVVLAMPHFSRGWSYKLPSGGRAGDLGRYVASLVNP